MPNSSDILQFRIFADDTNIFYSAKSPNILQRVINEELNKVYQYCSANKLSINFKKTNYMLITSKPRNNTLIHIPNITHTSCIKYLGVYIDEHLDWHNQITYVNNKIAKNVGILFRLRYHLNMQMLTNLYYTLIYPYLNYGLMSWGTTYKTKLKRLSSKVNKCITCIFFANGCEDPSPFYKLLGILKFDNLIKLKTASFISQLRSRGNKIPELFSELWHLLLASIHIVQGGHHKKITIGLLHEQIMANSQLSFLLLNYGKLHLYPLNYSLLKF